MKREREEKEDGHKVRKVRKLEPTTHQLHVRLRKLGLAPTGTKKQMMKKLRYAHMSKKQLIEKLNEVTEGVHIPMSLKKNGLVHLLPKIERCHERTIPDLKAKLERMHHFVHEMPHSSAHKQDYVNAVAEALIYKEVNLHAESDEESEIDMLFTKKDLLHQLNNIDSQNIKFSPTMTKAELIAAYQKYVLDLEQMTKLEIREKMAAEFPNHLPMVHVTKKLHIIALAKCLFHQEFPDRKIFDDPKVMLVEDLKEKIKDAGVKFPDSLHREGLEEVYQVFVYGAAGHMTKADFREFLNDKGVEHGLTKSNKKSDHIKAFHNYFIEKHNLVK